MDIKKKFLIVIVGIAILLVLWVVIGFEGNELPYVTIQGLRELAPSKSVKRFRLGGNVQEGSIIRDSQDQLAISFTLEQGDETLLVNYHRIVPDMFKEGTDVIVEGYYIDGKFQADNIMTKCSSRYEDDLREAESYN